MALTGLPDGPALPSTGSPACVARRAAAQFEKLAGVAVDGPALFGERAALMGLRRGGAISCGGGTRLLPAADRWWTLNLARDVHLVEALVERRVAGDPWQAVRAWARKQPAAAVLERATLLGLPATILGETPAVATPDRVVHQAAASAGRRRPVVVCLAALWAGPLTASLLALSGAEVVHVESSARPDPTRDAAATFHALLRAGTTTQVMDFDDRARLSQVVRDADIVIEASRPRAFQHLGLHAEKILGDGRARTWLRIRAHADPRRVGFGDDAATAGGLIAWDQGHPVFAGDAIADPLTGLLGALAVVREHRADRSALIEMRLAEVAAYCRTALTCFAGSTSALPEPAEPRVADRVPKSPRWN